MIALRLKTAFLAFLAVLAAGLGPVAPAQALPAAVARAVFNPPKIPANIGLVADRAGQTPTSNDWAGASYVYAACRESHTALQNISALQVGFYNAAIPANGAVFGTGGPLNIVAATVEYPAGVRKRLLFGGAGSGYVRPVLATPDRRPGVGFSDMLPVVIPSGAQFWIWADYYAPSGVVHSNTGGSAALGDGCTYSNASITRALTGAAPSSNIGATAYVPTAGVWGVTNRATLLLMGDSITRGVQDTLPDVTDGRRGITGKGLPAATGFFNFGQGGQLARDMWGRNPFLPIINRATSVINAAGVNDLNNAQGAANTATSVAKMLGDAPARGRRYATTITPPGGTSTNGFIDTAGQTPGSGLTVRNTYNNTYVRAGLVANADGYFDLSDYAETARDSGKWKVFCASPRTLTDVVTTTGGTATTVTSASASFTSADVGCGMIIPGAGPASGTLSTYIVSLTSGTQVVLAGGASTAASGLTGYVGGCTPDSLHPNPSCNAGIGAQIDYTKVTP